MTTRVATTLYLLNKGNSDLLVNSFMELDAEEFAELKTYLNKENI